MGRRLAGWRALDGGDRLRLLGCAVGLGLVHASLALLGYKRTLALVERCSRQPDHRQATGTDLADARALARLASIASRHGMVEATCLRRSLLLHGWLRRRGLRPALQLGVPETHVPGTPFQAHAWVELEGEPLLAADAGYRPFTT